MNVSYNRTGGSPNFIDSTSPDIPFSILLSFGNCSEGCEEVAERRSKCDPRDLRPFVLVADDEPLIRATIVEILKQDGYDAVGVQDGADAVECAHRLQPDVFLTDVAMPRMNGIEAAKQIKLLCPKARIICFSGHAATSTLLANARTQGHDFEFLSKPIRPEALLQTIRTRTV